MIKIHKYKYGRYKTEQVFLLFQINRYFYLREIYDSVFIIIRVCVGVSFLHDTEAHTSYHTPFMIIENVQNHCILLVNAAL